MSVTPRAESRLIVVAKRPLPGYAKTRLGEQLGHEQAAGVYARLLYTYLTSLAALECDWLQIDLAVAAPEDVPFFAAAFPEFHVRPQVEGDLGARLSASIDQAFGEGSSPVVITASDTVGLDAALILEAFDLLATFPAVIGPSLDGGYYLLGLHAPCPALFEEIAWSTSRVLAQTEARAKAVGMRLAQLRELLDVDTGAEYATWLAQSKRR